MVEINVSVDPTNARRVVEVTVPGPQGPAGLTPEFRANFTHLQVRSGATAEWRDLVPLSAIAVTGNGTTDLQNIDLTNYYNKTQIESLLGDKLNKGDSRLTDTRIPTDSSITDSKVASNAAINADKISDGTTNKVYTITDKTKLSNIARVGISGDYNDLINRPTNGTVDIADGTVTTTKIASAAVTEVKLADGSVTSSKLATSSVTTDKLAAGSIVAAKLATASVGVTHLVDGAIVNAKVSTSAAISADKIADGITNKVFTGAEKNKLSSFIPTGSGKFYYGPVAPASPATGDVWLNTSGQGSITVFGASSVAAPVTQQVNYKV